MPTTTLIRYQGRGTRVSSSTDIGGHCVRSSIIITVAVSTIIIAALTIVLLRGPSILGLDPGTISTIPGGTVVATLRLLRLLRLTSLLLLPLRWSSVCAVGALRSLPCGYSLLSWHRHRRYGGPLVTDVTVSIVLILLLIHFCSLTAIENAVVVVGRWLLLTATSRRQEDSRRGLVGF
jgi:hypothetical protein